MKIFKTALAGSLLALATAVSSAQEAPVRVIVPFSAGGPSDVVARLAAKAMSETMHRNFIVENKPGATGSIATQYVANSKPDGLTILAGTKSAMATGPLLMPSVKVDPARDFIPIGMVALDDLLLLASPKLPVQTVQDFIKLAKSKPYALNYGTSGIGSSYHFDTELLSSLMGIQMTHVPYKGVAPAFQDLMAGRIDVQLQTYSQVRAYLGTDKVKALAVASSTRLADFPNIPTVTESAGVGDFEAAVWTGLFVPKGTPDDVVQALRAGLRKAVDQPEFQANIKGMGLRTVSSDPAEISKGIASDVERWRGLVDSGRVKLQ